MSLTLEESLKLVQSGQRPLQIVYQSHDAWPLPLHASASKSTQVQTTISGASIEPEPLRICVFDSSFNPPTRAHLALAKCARPYSSSSSSADSFTTTHEQRQHPDYTARLLLLSVRNADKLLKPGDATLVQRLEMVILLAKVMESDSRTANVAVGIIDEPTFVGKSTALLRFLNGRLSSSGSSSLPSAESSVAAGTAPTPSIRLTFLVGMDTLERLFAPRYYGSPSRMQAVLHSFFALPPEGEGSFVHCAHRGTSEWLIARKAGVDSEIAQSVSTVSATSPQATTAESSLQTHLEAADSFVRNESITFVDLDGDDSQLSSSEVRARIQDGIEWQSMVPKPIAEYLLAHNLYRVK